MPIFIGVIGVIMHSVAAAELELVDPDDFFASPISTRQKK
jgi:hypothetical protein